MKRILLGVFFIAFLAVFLSPELRAESNTTIKIAPPRVAPPATTSGTTSALSNTMPVAVSTAPPAGSNPTTGDLKTKRLEFTQLLTAKRLEISKNVAAKTQELKTKLAVITDSKKRSLAEKISTALNDINRKQTTAMQTDDERLSQILEKLSSRSAELNAKGTDMSNVSPAITSAQDALQKSQDAVALQAAKVYEIQFTDEITLKAGVQTAVDQLKSDLKLTRDTIVNTKVMISQVAQALSVVIPATKSPVLNQTPSAVTPAIQKPTPQQTLRL